MRRPHPNSGFGSKFTTNNNLQSVTQVPCSSTRSEEQCEGLSKTSVTHMSTKFTKIVPTIFMLITVISFWMYNGFNYENRKPIIFQLYPMYGNVSHGDIFIPEVDHRRTLLNAKISPPTWMVKSFFSFFYIELYIAEKPYHMVVDSGSTLSWVNCKVGDIGPSSGDYLGKLNEPYTPRKNNLVLMDEDICDMIVDWHATENKIISGDSKFCEYHIEYGDSASASGVWAKDAIQYKTFIEKSTNHLSEAFFGCTCEFQSNHLDSRLDGVLGLQHLQDVSLPSQFTTELGLPDSFGHCILMEESEPVSGYLIFGWHHSLPMSADMKWVPMNEPESFRQRLLKLHKLFYGKDEARVQMGNIAFDSGSIQSYMREDVYGPLNDMVAKHGKNLGYEQDDIIDSEGFQQTCWKADKKFSPNAFNKIIFQFEKEIDLEISPKEFIRHHENEDHYCFGLVIENLPSEEESTSSEDNVFPNQIASIGGVWLTNKLLIYDNEELRIGFKNSDCKLVDDKKRKRGPEDPGPSVESANKKRSRHRNRAPRS